MSAEGSTPSEIGSRAELAVAHALMLDGRAVYLPLFSAHGRADLIVEDDGGLRRVQCKTSRVRADVLLFRTCSNTANTPKQYRGEVDVFGVYSPELDRVFMVPIDDVPSRLCHLRLRPARNGQEKLVKWATDYLVGDAALEG